MISFAGVDLSMPDPWGDLSRWLESYLPLEDLRLFCPPVSVASLRSGSRDDAVSLSVNLPVANWPAPPTPKLNTLYWPTGATRWAVGLFLATETQVSAIVSAIGSGGTGVLTLRTHAPNGDVLESASTTMHLLAVRRLSYTPAVNDTAAENVNLLVLVDERYWWQFKSTDFFYVDPGSESSSNDATTWTQYIAFLNSALGITVSADSISADYFLPDTKELARCYQNPAVLLDAVAFSLGMRIVRRLDGTVRMIGAAASASTHLINMEYESDSAEPIAGGEFRVATRVPAQVRVLFPFYRCQEPYVALEHEPYPVNISASGGGTTVSGTKKVIVNTFPADYTGLGLQNSTDLTTLATKIAADYYAYLGEEYDITYGGIRPWTLTGFDDYLYFMADWGNKCGDDGAALRVLTRVASLPHNWGVEEMTHTYEDGRLTRTNWFIATPTFANLDESPTSGTATWGATGSSISGGNARVHSSDNTKMELIRPGTYYVSFSALVALTVSSPQEGYNVDVSVTVSTPSVGTHGSATTTLHTVQQQVVESIGPTVTKTIRSDGVSAMVSDSFFITVPNTASPASPYTVQSTLSHNIRSVPGFPPDYTGFQVSGSGTLCFVRVAD